jgi:hypothetical protein
MEFADEDAASVWIIRNQFGRRNLPLFVRSELVLKLEPLLKAKAKEKQQEHGGTAPGKKSLPQKSAEVNTRKELAAIAHVSHDTIQPPAHRKIKRVWTLPEPGDAENQSENCG